jgi:hypothetical protein
MKIEDIIESNKSELIKTINDHWKNNHILVKNSKVFDLQHKNDNTYSFLTLKHDNTIKSFLGYIYSNSSKNSLWLAIWKSIDSGSGGVNLLFHLISNNPEFIGVIGVSDFTSNITKKLGWVHGEMDHYYLSLKKKKNSFGTNSNNEEYVFSDSLNLDFLKLSSETLPLKDKEYYLKRYLKHPVFEYKYLSIKSLVFIGRIVKYQNSIIFHVVDVIGDLKDMTLKPQILFFLKREKIDMFEMMHYDSRPINIDLNLKDENEIIPIYFNPFEYRNIKIELAYKTNKDLPVRFFLGDGDQDRPN